MAWEIVELTQEYIVVKNDGGQAWTYARVHGANNNFDFERLYKKYPHAPGRAPGKKSGMRKLMAKIKTQGQYDKFEVALDNLIKEVETGGREREFVPMWSTFCGSKWEDYLPENFEVVAEEPEFS